MASILDVIGDTPLIKLQRLNENGRVFVKLEGKNPGGSVKDRPALQMIKDGLENGTMNKDTVIIEPTSGNTGIGLCMVAAALQMKAIIVMPKTMSEERKKLVRAYGAELVLTEGCHGIQGAVNVAEEIHKERPNSVIVGQFVNPSNPKAHMLTTGPELVRQCEKYQIKPSFFVSGVGSGGTVTGIAPVLRKEFSDIKMVAVEPTASPLLSGGKAGPHKIQGISPNFIAEVLDRKSYDEIKLIEAADAYDMCRQLAKREGILVGISSAAAIKIAIQIANETGKDVIAMAADNGERYLSVEGLFE